MNMLLFLYKKYRDRIVVLLLAVIIALIYLLFTDNSTKKINQLESERIRNKTIIKEKTEELKTAKEIQDNYKQYYKNALQRIYEYEQAFELIKSKNNEKIKSLPRLSDAELEQFFTAQAREWSLSQQTKSTGNCP
jgi:predicted P-loop ATPase/GTPase